MQAAGVKLMTISHKVFSEQSLKSRHSFSVYQRRAMKTTTQTANTASQSTEVTRHQPTLFNSSWGQSKAVSDVKCCITSDKLISRATLGIY